jgi:hypothetical protein
MILVVGKIFVISYCGSDIQAIEFDIVGPARPGPDSSSYPGADQIRADRDSVFQIILGLCSPFFPSFHPPKGEMEGRKKERELDVEVE